LNVNVVNSLGKTPLENINVKHRDLTNLSLFELCNLILIYLRAFQVDTIPLSDIAVEIDDAISEGKIPNERIDPKLLKNLDQYRPSRAYKRARRLKEAQEAEQKNKR